MRGDSAATAERTGDATPVWGAAQVESGTSQPVPAPCDKESRDAHLAALLARRTRMTAAEIRLMPSGPKAAELLVDVHVRHADTMHALGLRPRNSSATNWRSFVARTDAEVSAVTALKAGQQLTTPCIMPAGTITAPAMAVCGRPDLVAGFLSAAGITGAFASDGALPKSEGAIITVGVRAFMAPSLRRSTGSILAGSTLAASTDTWPIAPPFVFYVPAHHAFYLLDAEDGRTGAEATRHGFQASHGRIANLYRTSSPAAARRYAHLADPELAFRLDGLYDRWPFAFAKISALDFETSTDAASTGGSNGKKTDEKEIPRPISYDASTGDYLTTDVSVAMKLGLRDLRALDHAPRWGFRDLATALTHRESLDDHAEAETLCRLIERAVPLRLEDVDPAYPIALRDGQAFDSYQIEGVRHALRGPVMAIGDDMGTGKTIMGTSAADCVRHHVGGSAKILVVVPASQLDNWTRTLTGFPAEPFAIRRLDPLAGSADCRPGIEHLVTHHRRGDEAATRSDGRAFALVVSYEVATVDARILGTHWDLVVFDEAHNLKNPQSQRGRALGCGPDGVPTLSFDRTLWMTGTEITAGVADMWQFIAVLLSKAEPMQAEGQNLDGAATSFKRFRSVFQPQQKVTDGTAAPTPEDDPDHHDALRARRLSRLAEAMDSGPRLRRLKAEVMPDLKPTQRRVWRIAAPTPEIRASVAEQARLLDLHARTPLWEAAERMRLANSVNELRLATSLAKVPTIARAISRVVRRGDPVLLFSHHIAVAEGLQAELAALGETPTLVHGQSHTPSRRGAVIRAFQNGEGTICNTTIAATYAGYQITRVRYVFFAELDWRYKHLEQAIDRANRRGQTRKVQVRFFVIPGSFDDRMANNILEKSKVSDIASGDDRRRIRLRLA